MSTGFIFPIWHRYYSQLFAADNLFVMTFGGNDPSFANFELGELKVIDAVYNDDIRVEVVTAKVAELLHSYDVVLRVDVDEFLVVDPARFQNLRAFIDQWQGRYITARGFDIIQMKEQEPLDLTRPILEQRPCGYALDAMNKTCVTRIPLKWGRGFHYCSAPPAFGDVFLLHLKRVDAENEKAWCRTMLALARNDAFAVQYYTECLNIIDPYRQGRAQLPFDEGEDALLRASFMEAFTTTVRFDATTGLYDGPYRQEATNVVVPRRFRSSF